MTWAERFGDLATNVALIAINTARVFTLLIRILTEKLDDLITWLAERGEEGIKRTDASVTAWLALPASVLFGTSSVVLRVAGIATVLALPDFTSKPVTAARWRAASISVPNTSRTIQAFLKTLLAPPTCLSRPVTEEPWRAVSGSAS